MMKRVALSLLAVALLLESGGQTRAGPFDNSLWLGNDLGPGEAVVNTDRMGNVLRTIPNTPANGIAVDLASNTLYIATTFDSFTPYSLTTLTPKGPAIARPISEDLAFDGTHLVSADYSNGTIDRINPSTGAIDSFITVGATRWG
jgi:hypothetical protein